MKDKKAVGIPAAFFNPMRDEEFTAACCERLRRKRRRMDVRRRREKRRAFDTPQQAAE